MEDVAVEVEAEECPRDRRELCSEEAGTPKPNLTDEQIINKRLEDYENAMNDWREEKRYNECTKKAQEDFIAKHPDFVKEFKNYTPGKRIFLRGAGTLVWLKNHDENGNELTEADEPIDTENEGKKWLTPEELEKLRNKINECMERQKEILDTACDFEQFKDMPTGHFNALVDEYAATEKLKLILVDRLHANLRKQSLHLYGNEFSSFHCGYVSENK